MRSIDIHAHVTPQCFWRAKKDAILSKNLERLLGI